MKKILIILVILLFLTGVVLRTQELFLPASDAAGNVTNTTSDFHDVPYQRVIGGVYTCLPHKDTNGPQTLECALGMKLDDGTYIALDWGDKLSKGDINLKTGSRITVAGLFVPVEQLNTDQWQQYPITGILQVMDVEL